ncbi:Pyruvate dehydrogenase E1 component subunit alpha, testis-specific form, mitochondrial [Datura stramonium]|uniref:Pyruvate dehydrogenase E1 component subunit alpha, testis-specific form, mitochondrial n=1 Tax=Datura stramonium TaxID=4076 RepID=A0ABS8TCT7_DATST|nr:Pyruvate dehydrogenase E1 component subunit alpha, testis-specific form, mitochondrial [Datura stramonium]
MVVKDKKLKADSAVSNLLITKDEGLELYEDMVLGRAFEDMCAQMYYRGKMFGFVHLYNGQEAVSTGFIKLQRRGGFCGAAFTSKYRREVLKEADCDHVTMAFFGDGTCNNGQFFECLNMAALWKLPIIFVVENNLWAIGMSHLRATSDPEIWKKGPALRMPGVHVDGMDVLKVREVAKEAVARARRGGRSYSAECETYRLEDTLWPIQMTEKNHYAARDPISALKKYMFENNLASEAELKTIDKKITNWLKKLLSLQMKALILFVASC